MAAIHEIRVAGANSALRLAFATELWAWIHEHDDDHVFTVHIWVVRKTFTVRDLTPAFVLILGPDPSAAPDTPGAA